MKGFLGNMLVVLEQVAVSPYFSLAECLNWVAFGEYPTDGSYDPDGGLYNDEEVGDRMFDKARNEPWLGKEAWPFVYGALQEVLGRLPDFPDRQSCKDNVQWEKSFKEYQKEYSDILESYLAPHQSEIFLRLYKGDLTAFGRIKGELKPASLPSEWQAEESWDEGDCPLVYFSDLERVVNGESLKGFQKIPREFWNHNGIFWESSEARARLGWYEYIFLPASEVFGLFPPPEPIEVRVEKRGAHLVLNISKEMAGVPHGTSRVGRPSYNWPEFHAEINRYCLEKGKKPKLQKELEHHMQDWCTKNWKKAPSHGAMQPNISAYYKNSGNSDSD